MPDVRGIVRNVKNIIFLTVIVEYTECTVRQCTHRQFESCLIVCCHGFTSLKNSISFTALQDRAVTIILYFDNSKNIWI